jgi:predicted PurR-regulated permease PerM
VATALVGYVCYRRTRPFLPALAWALVLAVVAHSLHWFVEDTHLDDEAERLSSTLSSNISSMLTGSVWAIAELLITLFAHFYFCRDRRPTLRNLRSLVPLSEAETEEVFQRIADTIYATVYGTPAVALAQGI